MKLITLLVCFTITLSLFAQSTQEKITIELKKAALKDLLNAIENQTKFRFVYGEDIKFKIPITLSVKNQSVESVLSKAFENQEIAYEVKSSHIILKKAPPIKINTDKRRYTISGYITDEIS